MSLALAAYRALTTLAEPFAPLWLDRRARRGKEERARLPERLAHDDARRPPGRLAWLHGASVGESLSLLPLVDALQETDPTLGVLVTSGTVTSAELLARRLPSGVLHRYAPLDLPGAARRFAARWRPDLAVFAESEIWPNLLTAVRREGARTALVSARLSDASLRGWTRTPAAARALFGGFDLVMAQDDATAAGLTALGARDDGRLNLKLAGDAPTFDADRLDALQRAAAGRPVLLAASTHAGEDEIVLDAFGRLQGGALLVIAPRHPERGRDVAELARERGFDATTSTESLNFQALPPVSPRLDPGAGPSAGRRPEGRPQAARRTTLGPRVKPRGDESDGEEASEGAGRPHGAFGTAPVYVADTLGELGLWYALADSAVIGGSLLPGPGGHNPLEPARLATPALTGPHIDNWRGVFGALGDATPVVDDAESLSAAWAADLADPAAARRRGEAARERAQASGGDLTAVAVRLLALIEPRP